MGRGRTQPKRGTTACLPERVDRRRRYDPPDGLVGRRPPQLVGDIPGTTLEDGVAEQPDRQTPDTRAVLVGDPGRDLAPGSRLVQQ
jgi:hypothetical protein